MITERIEKSLFENQDLKYREFQAKLIPGVEIEEIIGVRTPVIRKLAKEFAKSEDIDDFLTALPHKYYDENNLHGFIISECKDYEKTIKYLDEFLPYVNNWATCDLLKPKSFRKNKELLKADALRWISSDLTYTKRFGIETVMSHFLDEDFDESFLSVIADIRSDEYYINMMVAWFFATSLAKQWESVIPYIESNRLDKWTHNKTIQKSVESYRITDEHKKYLRTLKIN